MEKRTDAIADLTLYSVRELEPILGVSEQTIKRRIKAGELPARKISGKWKITRQDLEEYINNASAE